MMQAATNFGYATPGMTTTTATSAKSTTATSASAAKKGLLSTSSAPSARPKRTIGKQRELHRRHSGDEVQPQGAGDQASEHNTQRSLIAEFDTVR